MAYFRNAALALGCALALSACSSSSKDDLADTAGFCQALSTAWADKAAACGPVDGAAYASELAFMLDCGALAAAEAAGGFTYDRAAAQPCLDAFQALDCAVFDRNEGPPDSCQDAIVPGVAPGGACTSWLDVECIGGYCDFTACNLPGTCQDYLGEGEDCSASGRCQDPLTCNGSTCAPSTPQEEVGLGASCGSGAVRCGGGLFCDYGAAVWVCAARRTSGACSSDEACAVGFDCVNGTCAAERGVGAACQQGAEACVAGLWCDTSSRCARWNGVGGACGTMSNGEYAECLEGWCQSTVGLSIQPAATPPPGTCRAFHVVGATCDPAAVGQSWLQCGPGATCEEGTCARNYCGRS